MTGVARITKLDFFVTNICIVNTFWLITIYNSKHKTPPIVIFNITFFPVSHFVIIIYDFLPFFHFIQDF